MRAYRKRAQIRCNAIFRTGQFFSCFFVSCHQKHAGVVLAYRRDDVEKYKKQMLFSVGCFTDSTATD
ncbi:hypothetical protein CCZ15_24185 [Escherichia coli]|nr:hypothetical protein [Escherichia coli O166:H6]EFN6740693.1 hypothetical protein [Escherichia coli H6]EFO1354453.1 hypothetical protein [Escherichia coli]RBL15873.1 hypothetical protein CCZ10_24870 [Escherichia coli]RBL52604.1 hypothetical protein CCZ15_24185 [Escherichia coli]